MEKIKQSAGIRSRVLIVDDEMINREILGNILQDTYEITFAENGRQALDILSDEDIRYSLILLDLLMPEMDGFEMLEALKEDERLRSIPVIVMTSEKEAEVRSIKLGAIDFITKPYHMPEVILARCERIIEMSENEDLIRSAGIDELTGLYSRVFFFEYIRQFKAYKLGLPMDAIVININHFHLINEIHGRKKGNDVLRMVAGYITGYLDRISGIACRAEADTFYIYCKHRDDYKDIMDEISAKMQADTGYPKIRIRVGIYPNIDNRTPVETIYDRARLACDRLRGDFTRSVEYYSDELHQKTIYNENLINDIDRAIEDEDFIVYYQPKYAVQGDRPRLSSAEALIRWKHPSLGMISPGDFIPLFEENGLIQRLDHYVWSHAGAQIKEWKDKYGITIPVSVNVSRIDIYDPELEKRLTDILKSNGISEKDLLLEITESAYSNDSKRLIEVVESLRRAGFRIEMDDFGSGYSSLNMLTSLPIDVLKIDMKFIRGIEKDEKERRLVTIIMDIARFLKVPVVAEGVENKEQLEIMKDMGCDLIQGFYFSRPVPPEEFEALIEKELSQEL